MAQDRPQLQPGAATAASVALPYALQHVKRQGLCLSEISSLQLDFVMVKTTLVAPCG